jgi:predicted nucleic acid-binding Zn ribbon protein
VSHGVHGDSPSACPLCGSGPVRKAITAAAIHYKGSGWAKKERRSSVSSGTPKSAGEGTATPEDGSKSEGGPAESATNVPAKAAEAGVTSKTD